MNFDDTNIARRRNGLRAFSRADYEKVRERHRLPDNARIEWLAFALMQPSYEPGDVFASDNEDPPVGSLALGVR